MATNEIYPFGTSGTVEDDDVLELSAYQSDAQRLTGHQAGIARRALANTVLRQLAHMSAGLAQFIANRHTPGVVDDGDLDKVEAGLLAAIEAIITDNAPDLSGLLAHLTDTSNPHSVTAVQVGQATTAVGGCVELATNTETTTGTDDQRVVTPAGLAAALAAQTVSGVDTIYIGGGAMTPSVTDGATPEVIEDETNDLSRSVMSFADDADSSAEFELPMPANWNGGTLKFKVFWTAADGTAGDDVRMTLAARALTDDGALDQALGTAVEVTDDLIAAGDLHITAASAALTVAGSPAGGKLVRFKLVRDHDYGASALAQDVQVLGVLIQYSYSGAMSAW